MISRHREIWYALVAMAALTASYVGLYVWDGMLPGASSFLGHSIGVVGFVLMLATETAYSIRKQLTDARWGDMATWLRLHIFTGLVGPYMVLMHTAIRFRGLAAVVTLLTIVVVASGAVGRYLYTAVPREPRFAEQRQALAVWRSIHIPLTWALFATAAVHILAALYYVTLQR